MVSMAAVPQLYVRTLICWQTNSQLLRTQSGFLYFFFSFPRSLSLSHSGLCSCFPYTVSDSTCLYPCLHLTPRFFFFFSQACSLPRYLSLCQGPNVGLQMKQLDFHLRLPGINMCCSLSGRTLSTSPMLSRGRMAKQMKRPQLLARKHRTKGDIIQLFSVRIYYII